MSDYDEKELYSNMNSEYEIFSILDKPSEEETVKDKSIVLINNIQRLNKKILLIMKELFHLFK